ncbi:hypothetical protein Nepgr_004324 [Nepenthes gracilis]|uniref:AP2/ERF domain-containing protein n=1 Tax=Nepenthes gracilis TaxID=150966 RepID=A0AAD3S151_NEPGR|nr:hypothetical protein Nepgr_004324 [Nepenthes gracilis]
MVSLRRRRLLGLCSGVRNSFLAPLPRFCDIGIAPENAFRSTNPVSVHPMPLVDKMKPTEAIGSLATAGSSHVFGFDSSKDQSAQPIFSGCSSSKEQKIQPNPGQEVKRRKRHRRKHINNQDQCVMRGVYFKNLKWQAAIKVDKKQIHLGTVRTQEEAAHLYDRAAFMCGREPNFELSEAEKQELLTYNWDEFLAMTRRSITSKKTKRWDGAGSRIKSEPSIQNSDSEAAEESSSASDDAEQDLPSS